MGLDGMCSLSLFLENKIIWMMMFSVVIQDATTKSLINNNRTYDNDNIIVAAGKKNDKKGFTSFGSKRGAPSKEGSLFKSAKLAQDLGFGTVSHVCSRRKSGSEAEQKIESVEKNSGEGQTASANANRTQARSVYLCVQEAHKKKKKQHHDTAA